MNFSIILSLVISLVFFFFIPLKLLQFFALAHFFVVILSFAYSKILYYGITAKHQHNTLRLFKSQKEQINIIIKNSSILNAFYVQVKDFASAFFYKDKHEFLIRLAKGRLKKISYEMQGDKRGEFFIGPILISGSDPFGLFPWEKKIDSVCRVIIYPSFYRLKKNIKDGSNCGSLAVKNKIYEDLNQYKSIREYTAGDDKRRINWKVSAKLGVLHVMDFISSLNLPVYILLNLNFDDYPERKQHDLIEKAIDYAASLVIYFLGLKQKVGLLSNGLIEKNYLHVPSTSDINAGINILEKLAKIECNSGEEIKKINIVHILYSYKKFIPARTRIIVVSPKLTGEDMRLINIIRKKGLYFDFFQVGKDSIFEQKEFVSGKLF